MTVVLFLMGECGVAEPRFQAGDAGFLSVVDVSDKDSVEDCDCNGCNKTECDPDVDCGETCFQGFVNPAEIECISFGKKCELGTRKTYRQKSRGGILERSGTSNDTLTRSAMEEKASLTPFSARLKGTETSSDTLASTSSKVGICKD